MTGLRKTCLAVALLAGIGGLLAWELPRAEAYLFVPKTPDAGDDSGDAADPGNTKDPPAHAPEPATLLTAVIGGGLAGWYALRKRRKDSPTDGSDG